MRRRGGYDMIAAPQNEVFSASNTHMELGQISIFFMGSKKKKKNLIDR